MMSFTEKDEKAISLEVKETGLYSLLDIQCRPVGVGKIRLDDL